MRASTLLNALLELPGVWVGKAAVVGDELQVMVGLRGAAGVPAMRSRPGTATTPARWTRRGGIWTWVADCRNVLRRRRLRCPEHGVRAEGVPFARHRSGHTRDFEDLVAWLVTKTDKTTVSRLRPGRLAHGRARSVSGSSATGSTPTGCAGWSTSGSTRSAGGSTTGT